MRIEATADLRLGGNTPEGIDLKELPIVTAHQVRNYALVLYGHFADHFGEPGAKKALTPDVKVRFNSGINRSLRIGSLYNGINKDGSSAFFQIEARSTLVQRFEHIYHARLTLFDSKARGKTVPLVQFSWTGEIPFIKDSGGNPIDHPDELKNLYATLQIIDGVLSQKKIEDLEAGIELTKDEIARYQKRLAKFVGNH